MGKQNKKVLIIVNAEWYFRLHWLPLILGLKKENYNITVVTSDERNQTAAIRKTGVRTITLPYSRKTLNPFVEFLKLVFLMKIIFSFKPTILHNITIRPIIIGTIAGRMLSVPYIVNSITGLGYSFLRGGLWGHFFKKTIMTSYKILFSKSNTIISFQNRDDRNFFVKNKIVPRHKTNVILGVGVNTSKFRNQPIPFEGRKVIMATRMLWDKGVMEFVNAAKLLSDIKPALKMILVGIPDDGNPQSVPQNMLKRWNENNTIEWWGYRNDMPNVIKEACIIVLPSYREGLPTILIEAASVGRPIITTNVPGCREVVRDGVNGFLIPIKDHHVLAERIKTLMDEPKLMSSMGKKSQVLVRARFKYELILSQYINLYSIVSRYRIATDNR